MAAATNSHVHNNMSFRASTMTTYLCARYELVLRTTPSVKRGSGQPHITVWFLQVQELFGPIIGCK